MKKLRAYEIDSSWNPESGGGPTSRVVDVEGGAYLYLRDEQIYLARTELQQLRDILLDLDLGKYEETQ
jgi:hypothetical protein